MKYTGLEPHIPIKYHAPSVLRQMDLLFPGINHSHRHLLENDTKAASDLTGKQIVDNATDGQLRWMRERGLIA